MYIWTFFQQISSRNQAAKSESKCHENLQLTRADSCLLFWSKTMITIIVCKSCSFERQEWTTKRMLLTLRSIAPDNLYEYVAFISVEYNIWPGQFSTQNTKNTKEIPTTGWVLYAMKTCSWEGQKAALVFTRSKDLTIVRVCRFVRQETDHKQLTACVECKVCSLSCLVVVDVSCCRWAYMCQNLSGFLLSQPPPALDQVWVRQPQCQQWLQLTGNVIHTDCTAISSEPL